MQGGSGGPTASALPRYRGDIVGTVRHGDRQWRLALEIGRVYRRLVCQQLSHRGALAVSLRAVQRRTHTHIMNLCKHVMLLFSL